jgi:hypothetical protein
MAQWGENGEYTRGGGARKKKDIERWASGTILCTSVFVNCCLHLKMIPVHPSSHPPWTRASLPLIRLFPVHTLLTFKPS